jgi:hypothetical protein
LQNTGINTPDPLGAALLDYIEGQKNKTITVQSDAFEDDEVDVSYFFRSYDDMPATEQQAMELAEGHILDIGAGAGSHSLYLQNRGLNVTAHEISPGACAVMRKRGVKQIIEGNFFDIPSFDTYDTIILMMNGFGLAGTVEQLPALLDNLRNMLNPGGCILADGADVKYLYEEDGNVDIDLANDYYGQFKFSFKYKNIEGEPFNWFYIDDDTLAYYAEQAGFDIDIVCRNEHHAYLARLTAK